MTHVLAVIDNDLAARPVVDTAVRLGRLLGHPVEAVHVREDGADTALAVAGAARIPLRFATGDPVPTIIRELDADVAMGVLGARGTPAGRRPAGSTALAVARATGTPLAIVPPDLHALPERSRYRLLVPLDGTNESSAAARWASRLFAGAALDVVALHVFDSATVPRFWDQPQHASTSWGREFACRHLGSIDARVELRTGSPGERVIEVAEDEQADLIALSWSQDLSGDHARTVRDVLTRSSVPVVLFPISHVSDNSSATPGATAGAAPNGRP